MLPGQQKSHRSAVANELWIVTSSISVKWLRPSAEEPAGVWEL